MSTLCINCSSQIESEYCSVCFNALPNEKEFCNSCCEKLEITIDVNSSPESNLVDTSTNPLFQTRNITGKILDSDDDIIANKQRNDEESSGIYWMYIFVIIFFLAMMVIYYT